MALTQQQIRIYMSYRTTGAEQSTAAAKAGISERSARRIDRGALGAPKAPARRWRTRADPFADVWQTEVLPQLQREPHLQAITLLEWLQERHPGQHPDSQLRTLQRRVKAWRARHGPDKEVMFPQVHAPGLRALSDFTQLKGVRITIAGELLVHRLYHFRLAYSGWCHARVVLGGESYTALAEGLAEALERLGGVPAEHRTDSLSAAFKNLAGEAAADLAERYRALCAHYGMAATRCNPGRAHENGSIESPHGHFKRRVRERLRLRGSTEFVSLDAYRQFINEVAASINRRNAQRIAAERAHLAVLPLSRGATYSEALVRVTSSSTFVLRKVLYSVPARLIGERLRVHLYDDRLVLHHGGQHLMELPRLRASADGRRQRLIDWRHLIGWLARKPRALAGLAFRDELLPGQDWRAIWQHLHGRLEVADACKRVVGALALAATHERAQSIGRYWLEQLRAGNCPTLGELQTRFARQAPAVPIIVTRQHQLAEYDALLPRQASRSAARAQEVHHG